MSVELKLGMLWRQTEMLWADAHTGRWSSRRDLAPREKPQTFDGEAGTYSDWRCAHCKPEAMQWPTS